MRPYGASGFQLTIDGHEEGMGGRRYGGADRAQCAGQLALGETSDTELDVPAGCDGQEAMF